jgi:multicomponent Na+:H+ antiporter subunit F
MMAELDTLFGAAVALSLALYGLSAVLLAIRAALGPSPADRVLAVDVMAIVVVGAAATLALATGEGVLIDATLAVALVGFLGTVGFARFLGREQES